MYWKEAVTALRDTRIVHVTERPYMEAVETLPAQVQNIGELLDAST